MSDDIVLTGESLPTNVINTPATETNVAPEPEVTPAPEPEKIEEVAPKTYTEDEVKAIRDAEGAKTRQKYERKMEKQRIEAETRAKVTQEFLSSPVPAPDEPSPDNYTDYNVYLKDLARHEVKLELLEQQKADEANKRNQQYASENERKQTRNAEIIERGNTKYEDFEDMPSKTAEHLSSKGLSFKAPMVDTLLEAENAQDIVHYLYMNLEEAERIAKLSPYGQAKEIGKLEDKLLQKPKPKPSNTPAPINPVEGSASFAKKLEDMSYTEMLERDKKRQARYMR